MKLELKESNKFNSEQKKEWWGDGEWVNEPDLVEFEYLCYKCEVKRISAQEPHAKEFCIFGGHLCGYVHLPINHICHGKHYDDIEIDVHGGLTYSEDDCIGFDCAHTMDIIPSMKQLRKEYKFDEIISIPEEFKNYALFNPVYRNIEFCIEQCKSMVKQLIEIHKNEQVTE